MESRITELEIRLTHLEDTIEVLNRTIIQQHTIIDSLQQQVERLDKKLRTLQASQVALESEETPPPHY